jgi:hypothetical protein
MNDFENQINQQMKMRKCVLIICCLVIALSASAQNAGKILLFNLSHVTGDSSRAISLKGEDAGFVQVVFTSTNCDSTVMKIGYSLVDTVITYPAVISGLTQPIILNKIAPDTNDTGHYLFTHELNNKTNSALGILVPDWRPYFMVFTVRKTCSDGEIWLIHKK